MLPAALIVWRWAFSSWSACFLLKLSFIKFSALIQSLGLKKKHKKQPEWQYTFLYQHFENFVKSSTYRKSAKTYLPLFSSSCDVLINTAKAVTPHAWVCGNAIFHLRSLIFALRWRAASSVSTPQNVSVCLRPETFILPSLSVQFSSIELHCRMSIFFCF